jgi:dTDP-4-amino-4,6-dideoxygalactose transaminase
LSKWRIALTELGYGGEEEAAIQRVLSNQWLSMGPEVQAFEQEFASALGVKHAIAVANGTAALHLAYIASGVSPGDEIIQPAMNFVAAANMTIAVRATPVFADIISLNEPTICPSEIEKRITPRTKAVVVRHYGGYLCHMSEIHDICQDRGITLIEDACHAVGARYLDPQNKVLNNRMAGTLGDIGCFSFFSNKNLATGKGGMVVTNRDEWADRLRQLRSHGMTSLTWDRHQNPSNSYDVESHGYNYRVDDIRAALGRAQLQKLHLHNKDRQKHVLDYQRLLNLPPGWIIPFLNYPGDSSYHLMVILPPDEETRQRTIRALDQAGIQTSLHYPCITGFKAFKHIEADGLEKSQAFGRQVITLPLFPSMDSTQIEEICSFISDRAIVNAKDWQG